ncbi:MAG: 2,5-dioxovalerate dehydrogenase [Phycisphaerae bacterium]|nr:MAG: 2,5-dioxovalerate dehydrogenase [Phycisphaerae bacterium]
MATPSVHHRESFRGFNPAAGRPTAPTYHAATTGEVASAGESAWTAFRAGTRDNQRAAFLESIASNLDRDADAILAVAREETALPEARLRGELARTTHTLRMFASLLRDGSWVEAVIDRGDPSRTPLPKPDLRRMLVPLGPVAVFGASNFPLAYGVAGGDTASALAAGCPVLVKGHSAHPGTGEAIAARISEAVHAHALPRGLFQYLPAGGARDLTVGEELVTHPRVRAVGFTGSVAGGKALVRLANARAEPIPVFAEMGSVNPVFVLPAAIAARGTAIAQFLAASATASGGQMCTCPGLIFVPEPADAFVQALREAFASMPPVIMLTPRIAQSYRRRLADVAGAPGAWVLAGDPRVGTDSTGPVIASPVLAVVNLREFLAAGTLREECFGPSTIVVRCTNADEFLEAAALLEGSLTATVHADADDHARACGLLAALADRAGRLIVNGVPTGVEVAGAMVHSGPFPACSRPDSTAVGPWAIRRWCRPVCFQNTPQALLPEALHDANPLGIVRVEDGRVVLPAR